MNNPKSGKSSLVKKILAGAIVVLLLIQPISAIMNDGTEMEQPDFSIAESAALGRSDEEQKTEENEDKQLSLGASGTIEISAPDRKIGFGLEGFDLKTGIKVTGVAGEDYNKNLRVLDDGGFNPHIIGEYQVSYGVELDGQILASATRTITVTEYVVIANDIIYQHGNQFPLKPEEVEAGESFGYYALIDDVYIEDGTGEQAYQYWLDLSVDDTGGIEPLKFGTFTLDYSYKVNGETAVQFSRTISVKPQRLTFSFTPVYMERATDMHGVGTPDGTYWKGVYMGANRTGNFYIGDADAVDPQGTHIPQQFYEGFYVGTLFGFTPEGEQTETLRYTDYLNANVGGNAMFRTRGSLVSLDSRTKRITWNQDDYKVAITYHLAEDSRVVDAVWAITNNSTKAVDMRLHFLGDTFFAGQDSGSAHFNARTKSVYVKTALNPEDYGMLALRASELTPFDYFYGGHPNPARDNYIFTRQNYPGTAADPKVNFDTFGVESPGNNLIDQALGLQWNFRVEAGETVSKKGQVIVTEAGDVQIMPPEGKKAPGKVILPYTFTLENISAAPQTVTMNIASNNGWNVEFANGKNTITIPGIDIAYVTVYLTIPASVVTGDTDKLTLSVTSDKTVTASTITTIDTTLPAQTIRIVDQDNTTLKVAVDFINVPTGEFRNTTISILNVDGSATNIPNQTRNIEGGDTFDFDITGLVFDKEYLARSEVVGIDYYSEKLFTISTMATSLALTRNGVTAPAAVNLKTGDTLTETLNAKVAPIDLANKGINWKATPSGTVTMQDSTQSGDNNAITFTKNGAVSLEARAAAAAFPAKTIEYTVDTQIPTVSSSTVTGTGKTTDPFVVDVIATDPLKDNYASGIDKLYYKVQLANALAPTFNPAVPTGWTLMTGTQASFTDSQNKLLKLYVVAVDLVGNTSSLYQHGETISSDTEAPVFSGVSDIRLLVGAVAPTFPDPRVTVTDDADGNIALNSSHVDKTTVSTTVVGMSEVTYTVADSVGNISTIVQKVYVYGLPIISVTDNVVSIHKNDTVADFDPSNFDDIRILLSAVVSTIDGTDTVVNTEVTNITASGTVNYGTIGDYPITYTAKYTHAGNLEATATKVITVKVVASLAGGPVITADTGTLRTFKDYPTLQITALDIEGNVTATGNTGGITYEILKKNGTPATLADVHGSISSYTVRYKAVASDGATAYLDVPLHVFGKLEYTAPANAFVLKDSGNYTAPSLTVTYKGDVGAGEVTFSDAVVHPPAPQGTTAVGVFTLNYKAGYPVGFGVSYEETVFKELIVQGRPVITTDTATVYLHPNDLAADFRPLTDSRVNPSAVVSSVAVNGTIDNNIPVAVTETNNIVFGTEGTYNVDYKAEYTHANGNVPTETTKRVTVIISSTVIDPNAPVLSSDASALRTYKDDPTLQLTIADVIANITVTGNTSPVTYEILKRDKTTVVAGGLTTVHNDPIASYYVRYTAEGVGGAKSYLDVDLFVYGGFTYTTPGDVNVLQGDPHTPPTLTATYEGDEGNGLETFDAVITAPPPPDTTVVGKYEPTYTIDYPSTFINAPSEDISYQLFVQGEAKINTLHNTVELHLNDRAADFDPLSDLRVGLSAHVGTVATDGTVNPSLDITPTVTIKENTIVYGAAGTYKVVFEVSYTHANGGLVTTAEKEIVVKISANPTWPGQPEFTNVTSNLFRTFADYPAYQVTDSEILGNVTVINNAAPLTYTILKTDGVTTVDLATVHTSPITRYTVRYKATAADGSTSYKDIPLYIYGELTFTNPPNVSAVQDSGNHSPTVLAVSYMGDEGSGVETFNDAIITSPSSKSTVAVGVFPMDYTVKYPARLGGISGGVTENATYKFYVYGKPTITSANHTIEIHKFDTITDFNPSNLTDSRLNVAALVDTIDGSDNIVPDVVVTNITVSGTVNYGTIGDYPITYTAKYTHAGNLEATATKVITVKVVASLPGAPIITADTSTLRTFKDYPTLQLTAGDIDGNVTVTGNLGGVTYEILKKNGTTATLSEVHGSISSYTVRYKAVAPDGATAYLDVPLYVFGKLEYTAPANAFVLKDSGDYTAPALTVTYKGDIGVGEVTFSDAVVQIPPPQVTTTVGAFNLDYKAGYPASFGVAYEETVSKELIVQGRPVITTVTATVYLHPNDLSADFRPLTDSRVNPSAVVSSVAVDGRVDNNIPVAVTETNNIVFGVEGTYNVDYKAEYTHANGNVDTETTKRVTVIISSTVIDPNAPVISADASTLRTYKDDLALQLTIADINANITVTGNISPVTYEILKRDKTTVVTGGIDAVHSAPIASYYVRYTAEGVGGAKSYLDVDLFVYGGFTYTTPGDVNVLQGDPHTPPTLTATYEGDEGNGLETFDAVITAPTAPDTTVVGKYEPTYTIDYPPSFINPPSEEVSYQLFVQGEAKINANTPVIVNYYDLAGDFNPLTDGRVDLSATVATVALDGTVSPALDITPTVTVKENTIIHGTEGTYKVVLEVTYTHPNGGVVTTVEKEIVVKVDKNPPTTPTTPGITIDVNGNILRTYKDYPAYQIDDAMILANATATNNQGSLTYRIIDHDANATTEVAGGLTTVHSTIDSYYILYKAVGTDDTTAYVKVPLYVYGSLEYTAPTNLQIEEGTTPHAPATMTATFKGDEGNGVETFSTPLVTTPAAIDISAVGKYNAAYSVKYPSAFGVTIEETPNYDLYVQGAVKISANSPINLILETTSLDLKNDIRIGLSASVETVALNGTVTTKTIPVTDIAAASTIVFGAEGSYKVTYSSSYGHLLLGGAVGITSVGTKEIDVIVSNNDPNGPTIEVINSDGNNTSGGKFWQFIGTGSDLNDGKITGGVNVTVKAPATTYTASYKILDENNNEVTLAVAISTPGEYKIRYEAKDDLDRVNVAYFDLYVVGEMEVTGVPKDIYTGVSTTPLSTGIYLPPNGTHAMKASFVNHDGTVKTAKITVDTTPVNINASGIIPLTYTAEYPDDLPAPISYGGEVDGSEVHVYELPTLNANGVVLSIHDTALDLLNDPRIGLGATVVDSSGTPLTIPKSNITVTPKNGNIQFGTIGSYEFVYSVYFDLPGGGGQIRAEKTVTINVTAAGDPLAPTIKVVTGGSDPIVYFQDFVDPSNVVDDNKIKNNVDVTPNGGATIVDLDYTILDNGTPISLEDAKDNIGSYTIRYEATDSEGRTSYHDVEFRVVGTITTTAGTAIDTMIGIAGAELPTTEYLGAKAITATFTDYDGTSKSAVVTAPPQLIDSVGTKEIVYSAQYPTPYNTSPLGKTETRLLRVHGKPQIVGATRIDLRVGAATTEMSSGVTASVQLAPLTLGGGVTTANATVGIVGVVDNTQISQKTANFNASFTLPAGYNALTLTNTAQREVVFHGKVELIGSDITLSVNFPAADFETKARPNMNVSASVKYFDTATNTAVEYPVTFTTPPSSTIRFGVKGTYPLTYTANDNGVAQKPAGLAGASASKEFKVVITDAVIGNAPTITVTHGPIDWLNTAPINLGELMTGVVATDVEDVNLTGDITVKVKKLDSGVVTDITATSTTLPAGKYEVIYTLLDSDSNKIEKVVEMFIHGHISLSASMGGNDTRQSTTPYVPKLTGMKFQYVNGVTGTTTIITPATNPLAIGTTQPNYNVSAIGDVTVTVKALHPVFGEQFKTFSGTTTPTSITTNEVVRVHGKIVISGQEDYNARAVVRNGKSYFTVGDDIGDAMLLSGVTAGYTNSSGTFINLTSTIKVAAPAKNTSKAGNFPATYSVKDDLLTTNPDITSTITISVDGKPKIQIDEGDIYVPVGSTEKEILDGANIIVTVEDGLTPGVEVEIPYEKEIIYEKGSDLNTPGNKGKVVITAKNPNNPSSVTKGEINFMVYEPPTIKLSGTRYLEMFKNEFTLEEVMKKVFDPSASYTDINGKTQKVEVKVDLKNFSLSQSGKYQFGVYIIDPITGGKISSPEATVFVLNRAYIQYTPQYTMTVPKEKLSNAQIKERMEAVGIGEEVVNGQITTRAFAVNAANGSQNQVKISQFAVNIDLRHVDQSRFGVGYKVPISGTFHYRNQLVEVEAVLFLKSDNTGGTSKPDVSVKPGNENKPDGEGGFLSGGNEEGDFQGDGNLSNAEMAFWTNTNKLMQTVGSKGEVWTITHSNSANPTKKGDGNSKIIAVPGTYLEMPAYIINTLKAQDTQRLQINMGDYIWYLDANSGWKDSQTTSYSIGVKASKNSDISNILGSGVANQQLTFGFKDGWSGGTVHLGVKINNSALQNQQLYMYYYNPYTNELEFVGDMENLGSNWHSVAVKGNYGEYVVSDQLLLNAKVANSDLINNPETGGQDYIAKYTHDLLNSGEIELPTTIQNSTIENAYTIGGSGVAKYAIVGASALGLTLLLLFFVLVKRRKEEDEQ